MRIDAMRTPNPNPLMPNTTLNFDMTVTTQRRRRACSKTPTVRVDERLKLTADEITANYRKGLYSR